MQLRDRLRHLVRERNNRGVRYLARSTNAYQYSCSRFQEAQKTLTTFELATAREITRSTTRHPISLIKCFLGAKFASNTQYYLHKAALSPPLRIIIWSLLEDNGSQIRTRKWFWHQHLKSIICSLRNILSWYPSLAVHPLFELVELVDLGDVQLTWQSSIVKRWS